MPSIVARYAKFLRSRKKFNEWQPRFKSLTVRDQHFFPSELAKTWGVDTETIRTLFRNEPGVVKIGNRNPKRKRAYLTLRIPESVVIRVHQRLSAGTA